MKKILITGAPGFAASHLIKHILTEDQVEHYQLEDIEIHGTKRVRSDMYRLEKMGIVDNIKFHLIEMTDAISVQNVIADVMPDQIYHLAAQDYVKSSWDAPNETFNTNVSGTINLFEAVRRLYPRVGRPYDSSTAGNPGAVSQDILGYPKILVTSTSETYGFHKEEIHELTEQRPNNPYAISKCTQDQLARLYAQAYNIPVVVTRAFNIIGWGRNDPFVDSNFAKQIVEIEKGRKTVIEHGNLQAKRSFFDVRDAVRGYYLAMEHEIVKGENGEVFCFGPEQSTSIDKLLKAMIVLSTLKITTKHDPGRDRPIDTPDMRCDAGKAEQVLGWRPIVLLRDSLLDLLNYWRDRL